MSASTDCLARFCGAADDPPPSVVMVAAHADDEVVGAGARLPRLREVVFCHVTDGAPRDMRDAARLGFATREDYARARRAELCAALAVAGIDPGRTLAFGYVDQEAALHLVDLTWVVADILRDHRPELVVTHPYEGGHPDHDAAAFAVHAACRLLEIEGRPVPTIVEMTSYHYDNGTMVTGAFLPHDGCTTTKLKLTEAEQDLKRRMIACYRTQQHVLGQFSLAAECFRTAPRYAFDRRPHDGTLFYELFPWGMTWERWTEQVREAIGLLGLRRSGRIRSHPVVNLPGPKI